MKHLGDPTPRSAGDVLADLNYKMVVTEQFPTISGLLMNKLVVLHCGTETYWQTSYAAMQPSIPMTWQQVEPVVETRTTYRAVP